MEDLLLLIRKFWWLCPVAELGGQGWSMDYHLSKVLSLFLKNKTIFVLLFIIVKFWQERVSSPVVVALRVGVLDSCLNPAEGLFALPFLFCFFFPQPSQLFSYFSLLSLFTQMNLKTYPWPTKTLTLHNRSSPSPTQPSWAVVAGWSFG